MHRSPLETLAGDIGLDAAQNATGQRVATTSGLLHGKGGDLLLRGSLAISLGSLGGLPSGSVGDVANGEVVLELV